MKRFAARIALPIALALASLPAHAAGQTHEGATKVLSGGVGLDARDQLAQQAKDYDLKLVFAARSGAYLADVPVQVTDRQGKVVVDQVSQGPWMFIDLPPGSYTVQATLDGKSEKHAVSLAGHAQKTLEFRWADTPGTMASR